jgi:hypothetical protein
MSTLNGPQKISGILPNSGTDLGSNASWHQGTVDLFSYCRWLTASADADIEFVDGLGNRSFDHRGSWSEMTTERVLSDLIQPEFHQRNDAQELVDDYTPLLTDVVDGGKIVGRAAFHIGGSIPGGSFFRVGGLTYPQVPRSERSSKTPPFVGILPGEVSLATRAVASLSLTKEALAAWATGQAAIGEAVGLNSNEKVDLAHEVFRYGGDPGRLPFAHLNGRFLDLQEFRLAIRDLPSISFPLTQFFDGDPGWVSLRSVSASLLLDGVSGGLCILQPVSGPTVFEKSSIVREMDKSKFEEPFEANLIREIQFGDIDVLFEIIKKEPESVVMYGERISALEVGRLSTRTLPVLTLVLNNTG